MIIQYSVKYTLNVVKKTQYILSVTKSYVHCVKTSQVHLCYNYHDLHWIRLVV